MQKILIIGATSAIAEATAKLYAAQGDHLYLLARDENRLKSIVDDLKVRGAASVKSQQLDVNDQTARTKSIAQAIELMGNIDVALIAHGTLPNQELCQQEVELMQKELETNAISTLSILTLLANSMEKQKQGTIAVISSVAGDRGRQSNYVYGAAKGMVSIFLQGLRNRLVKSGVNVIDIKPGFVDTPMTADFKKGLLWAQPESIAQGIVNAINKGSEVVYLPWFWRYIMLIIKSIPEFIFKKLSL